MSSLGSYIGAFNGGSRGSFPDPFIDMATLAMPQSMRTALRFCEYLAYSHGTYRMAMERIIAYFMTDVEFGAGEHSSETEDRWVDFFTNSIGLIPKISEVLSDRQTYGNAFVSVLRPFKRFLNCPKCGASYALNTVYDNQIFNFAWSIPQFVATCPSCSVGSGYRGPFNVVDRPDDDEKKIRIKRWSPHEMEILHDHYSDECAYLWRIPEDYKSQVRKGNLFHLERVSRPVLEAIRQNRMFRFHPDALFHMKEPCLAGIRNRGWGIPRLLSNFRDIFYVQVLRRQNEAIAMDYVIPFRLITPMPRPGGGAGVGAGGQAVDPMNMFNMGDFAGNVRRMLRRRQRDPATWNILPFPVQYQQFGGDASKLAPRDLLDQGTETLLNAVGTPVELYKGTLSLQASVPALRLFESTWNSLVYESNSMMRWFVRQVSQITQWDIVEPRLKRVTMADDLQRTMAVLQLAMGQQVSGSTAFKSLGLDYKSEQRQLAQDQILQQKIQAEAQKTIDQAGLAQQLSQGGGAQGGPPGGGAPAGGAPAGGQPAQPASPVTQFLQTMGPNSKVSPTEMSEAGDSLAQELLGMPSQQVRSEMQLLKARSDVMHATVTQKMKSLRDKAKNQGGQQVLQQQYGQP